MERNGFQNFFAVANKTCSRVADGHAGNKAYIRAGEIGKQYTTDGPVDDIHTGGIPRTDGNVESEFTALEVECGQIFRIMGKVSVDFQNKFVTFVNGILKAGKVGGSQAQFPFTFDEMEPRIVSRVVISLNFLHNFAGSIGRTIVDHENIEVFGLRKDSVNHRDNIIAFIVGRDYNDGVAHSLRADNKSMKCPHFSNRFRCVAGVFFRFFLKPKCGLLGIIYLMHQIPISMKNLLTAFLLLFSVETIAQVFEGTITWS